ncbi:hypothetical protein DFH06DRAFT_1434766 [Mycena polygramma]|nr:hypothetical protein DFH06DRAFT_1434766 [Mycena polygramma]
MFDTEDSNTLYSPSLIGDATSHTEAEPPSPDGSTKGLYIRSRPTSMDASSIIDFPGFGPDLDFSQFGMTPAVAHTAASPTSPSFPSPPVIASPPPGKKRRYAPSIKSLYKGDGTGTSLKTNRCPRDLADEPATPLPSKPHSSWQVLKRMITPGLFPRPTARTSKPLETDVGGTNIPAPAAPSHTRSTSLSAVTSMARSRALSFKSSKSKGKARAVGVENIAPAPKRRARIHSFSGYLSDSAPAEDEDETDAEMTAIGREALETALKLKERFEFTAAGVRELDCTFALEGRIIQTGNIQTALVSTIGNPTGCILPSSAPNGQDAISNSPKVEHSRRWSISTVKPPALVNVRSAMRRVHVNPARIINLLPVGSCSKKKAKPLWGIMAPWPVQIL